eukprot:57514-Rhodomonas_salina.1
MSSTTDSRYAMSSTTNSRYAMSSTKIRPTYTRRSAPLPPLPERGQRREEEGCRERRKRRRESSR